MFTSAQLLYLDEVLGTTPAAYRTTAPALMPAPANSPRGVLVRTPRLTPPERDLLSKILSSVALTEYTLAEADEVGEGAQVLVFPSADSDAGGSLGRTGSADGVVTWTFHPLARMLGTSAEVTRLKREVWTLLRDFRGLA